ncbi:MAG: glycerophosphodiester phosphodiesterase [Ignavibacteriae bacterium]|nr:glycerophosphodiester phosphodiesterase [Ignavibacteria bacterium]MBI3363531.1 glycerophosphodiester phosphodiesterase [Ignavibacteriota bacterium]
MRQHIVLLLALAGLGLHCNSEVPTERSIHKHIMIVAHRGAPAYAPENTLSSFRKALELHADALELDVHQTKDSQIVVMHDGSINRTTNGKGNVRNVTLAELRRLSAGKWFGAEFESDKVPTLYEVIGLCDSSTTLIVELKEGSDESPGIEDRIITIVRSAGTKKRIILKSFDRSVLARLHRKAPEIPLLYVYVFSIPWINFTVDHGLSTGDIFSLDVDYLQPHNILLTKSFIHSAHRHGYKVIAWDVQSESSMQDMLAIGVDGIETDYPDKLTKVLENGQK